MSVTQNKIVSTQKPRTSIAASSAGSAWTPSITTTTNLIQLATAGANGSMLKAALFTTTDTSANNVFLVLQPGGTGNLSIIGQVNVPLGSGTTASVFGVDALSKTTFPGLSIDNYGKPYILLGPNDILYFGTIAGVTSGKILFGTAILEDF